MDQNIMRWVGIVLLLVGTVLLVALGLRSRTDIVAGIVALGVVVSYAIGAVMIGMSGKRRPV